MVEFSPDIGKNRLVMVFTGAVDATQVATAAATLTDALRRLACPFDVLSDVRGLEGIDAEAMAALKACGERLHAAGVRRVVRIVGRSANGALHMERLARLIGHSARLAFSEAEAESVFQHR